MQGSFTIDGVEYVGYDQRTPTRSNANELAAKLGSGAGEYDDQLVFSSWLQDDWRAGIGKKDPEAGGSLVSTLDSRFDNQIALPPITHSIPSAGASLTGDPYSVSYQTVLNTLSATPDYLAITVSDTETGVTGVHKLAVQFHQVASTTAIDNFEVLLPGATTSCDQVYVELWACYDPTGVILGPDFAEDGFYHPPLTLVNQCLVTLREEPGWYWYAATGLSTEDTPATDLWYALVVYPVAGELIVPTVNYTYTTHWYYYDDPDLGTEPTAGWLNETSSFMARYDSGGQWADNSTKLVRFGDYIYSANGTTLIAIEDPEGGDISFDSDTVGNTITDLMVLDGRLYIGQGDSAAYLTIDTEGSLTTATAAGNARLFRLIDGLLWRAVGADLFYTNDEVTWTTVPVGLTSRETIRGFCGLNGEVLVCTNRAIYRVIQGDTVMLVSEWGAPGDGNGQYMINFQGNLYISMRDSVIRFDGENFLPYGPDLGEGLPTRFSGDIVGFAANNNWLLCAVGGATGSVWAHNGQGWHHITELPVGVTATAICYSHELLGFSTFVTAGDLGTFYRTLVADTKKVMRRAAIVEQDDYRYHHYSGWLETDWFYGGLREVQKDWESIYVDGENISARNFVDVYWQANDDTEWNLLGTISESTQEIRWDDPDTRPAGRRLRVGVALYNSFQPGTPVVTAIRVKYQSMLTDRWRWDVAISVKDSQEMLDGTLNQRNAQEMINHLDSLTKQVPPFVFQETGDENQYWVKVMNNTRSREKVRPSVVTGSVSIDFVYRLILEQVTASAIDA